MTPFQTLQTLLLRLDQQSYKAYKQIAGSYQFPGFTLIIDYVQGDPFAAPSRLRVIVPQTEAAFPAELYRSPSREIALQDYLCRQFEQVSSSIQERRGSGKSGLIAIASPQQQVLERSAILINSHQLEARFVVGLPARGRTILGRQAAELLCEDLPHIVSRSLQFSALNAAAIQQHVETVEDADWLRSQLAARRWVAFIPNGAILPRQSGVDDRPLTQQALPFQSPASLQVTLDRPNQGSISGMGIPQGVTLIVGGGYHGKSTLLKAIALGVYNHIPLSKSGLRMDGAWSAWIFRPLLITFPKGDRRPSSPRLTQAAAPPKPPILWRRWKWEPRFCWWMRILLRLIL
jgi:predicted ABC-class ATPase